MAVLSVIKRRPRSIAKVDKLVYKLKAVLVSANEQESPEKLTSRSISSVSTEWSVDSSRSLHEQIIKLLGLVKSRFALEAGDVTAESTHLVAMILQQDIPLRLIQTMPIADDKTNAAIAEIMYLLFQNGFSTLNRMVTEYMKVNVKDLYTTLVLLYRLPEYTIPVGKILRQCFRRRERFFVKKFLKKDAGYLETLFTEHLTSVSSAVVNDAYETLEALLLPDKSDKDVERWLEANHLRLCGLFNEVLLNGSNHTKRGIVKLLNNLLCTIANYDFRCKYLSEPKNFALIWSATKCEKQRSELKDRIAIIRLFVANPQKPWEIESSLAANSDALMELISYECNTQDARCLQEDNELLSCLHNLRCEYDSQ